MSDNTTIITPPSLKFGINEVVYTRESALLGYLEAIKIKRAYYDPNISRNVYVFIFKKNTPSVKTSGDAIDLMSNHSIILLEEDLCTFTEALSIKYNVLNREISKTQLQLSKFGKPEIDVNINEGLNFGNVSVNNMLEKNYRVLNNGDLDLLLTGSPRILIISDEDDFSVILQPSSQIESNDNSKFIIRFAPTLIGRRVGTILIISNDPITPNFTFVVEGVGV